MKKATKIFKILLLVLIILFIAIYISDINGYYAYSNYQRSLITEEGIKQFENDVKDGKEIDIKNYVKEDNDYENNISKTSLQISDTIGKYIRKVLVTVFKKITVLIE